MNVRDLSAGGFIQASLGHGFISTEGEAFTMLVYGKQAGSGPEWLYSFPGGSSYWTLGLEAGTMKLYKAGGSNGPGYSTTDWSLYVVTCAAGGAIPQFYIYNAKTATWEADEVGGSQPVEQTGTPPSALNFGVWNGGGSEHFDGMMAAMAYWRRALSKAEVHELISLGFVHAWQEALSPDMLLIMDEATPVDESGNGANVIGVEGTERKSVLLPFALREGEETEGEGGGEEGEGPEVLVKTGAGLVKAKRFVKTGGGLVPA